MQMSVIVSEQILVSYASMFQSVSIDVLEHTYLLLHLSKYLGTGTDVESPRLMRMIGPKMENASLILFLLRLNKTFLRVLCTKSK